MNKYFTGILESNPSYTTFGCVLMNGEEVMMESSAYGVKPGEVVVFELGHVVKFKRAQKVKNLNQVLEELSYYLFSEYASRNEFSEQQVTELKKQINLLLPLVKEMPKLSPAAIRAWEAL